MKQEKLFANGDLAWKIISADIYIEDTGQLGVLEYGKHIDFPVRRVFFVKDVQDGKKRGGHCHVTLGQVLICLNGSCDISLDAGDGAVEFQLGDDGSALHLSGMVWREMSNFSDNAVLLVLCDRSYADDVVIRSYEKFKQIIVEKYS